MQWGHQIGGQWLGFTAAPEFPVNHMQDGPRFTAVAAGTRHRCGVTSDGDIYCWGNGPMGQLGTGKKTDILLTDKWKPGKVKAVSGQRFTTVAAGGGETCALTANGTAYCWGENLEGQLGIDATDPARPEPTPVNVEGGD